jgi:hypothetical protein
MLKNGCKCQECRKLPDGIGHWCDCSVHNEPADPNGECDCTHYYNNLTVQENNERNQRIIDKNN